MLNIDVTKLEEVIRGLRDLLKDGLLVTDFWERSTGLTLAGFNINAAADALFNQVTADLEHALTGSSFPRLGRYYLLDLEDDKTVVIIQHGQDILQGMLLASKKTNLGVLFSVAVPRMLKDVVNARD